MSGLQRGESEGVRPRFGGDVMPKVFIAMLMVSLLASPLLAAQNNVSALQALKQRQKAELKAQKLQEKNAKNSVLNRNLPKAVRKQLKHQMAAQKRLLKMQQKQDRQAMKDQQKVMKNANRQAGFE